MVQELPLRVPPRVPHRFKRYFEPKNHKIRVFGLCEVTGKNFEMTVPAEGFFIYLQGFKTIGEALKGLTEGERHFMLTGISPEGHQS